MISDRDIWTAAVGAMTAFIKPDRPGRIDFIEFLDRSGITRRFGDLRAMGAAAN